MKVAKVRPKAGNFSSGDIEGREIMIEGRDRKAKRQTDRETEIQIDRHSNRETKRQRYIFDNKIASKAE